MLFPPLIPASIETGSVDFDANEFRRVLLQKGLRVWWEQYAPCPCRAVPVAIDSVTETRDAPNPTCTGCYGSGALYVYGQQIPLMTQMTERDIRWFTAMGPLAPGHMLVSALSENLLGQRDRITLIDGAMTFTELRPRTGDTDRTRYPILRQTISVGGSPDASVPVARTVGVTYATWSNAAGILQPELVEGVDFTLVARAGTDTFDIDWGVGDTLGTAPPVGALVSLRYFARPRFIVVHDVHSRRGLYSWPSDTPVFYDFPTTFMVGLEHLAGNDLGTEPSPSAHPATGY